MKDWENSYVCTSRSTEALTILHTHQTLSLESVFSDLIQMMVLWLPQKKTFLKIDIVMNKMIQSYSLFQRKSSMCFSFQTLSFWQDF